MAVPEKNGTRNCIFSFQKTYSIMDVFKKRHNSCLCVTCKDIRTQLRITALNPYCLFPFPYPQEQTSGCCCPLLDILWTHVQLLRCWTESHRWHRGPSFWPVQGCWICCGCSCDGRGVCSCEDSDCGTSSS